MDKGIILAFFKEFGGTLLTPEVANGLKQRNSMASNFPPLMISSSLTTLTDVDISEFCSLYKG